MNLYPFASRSRDIHQEYNVTLLSLPDAITAKYGLLSKAGSGAKCIAFIAEVFLFPNT
jgi:hypothetical protein